MAEIRVTPSALNDLIEIKTYIEKDLSNPIAANRTINRIINDYSQLEISPYAGRLLSTKLDIQTDYRFIVSGNYIIFYKTDENFVSIYRILYAKRDYMKIIFNDSE